MATKSSDLYELLKRKEKAWAVFDYYLSIRKRRDAKNQKVTVVERKLEQACAEFVLKRLYPERTVVEGQGHNPIPIILVRPSKNGDSDSGSP